MKYSRYIILAVIAFFVFVMLCFLTTMLFSNFPLSFKLIAVAMALVMITIMIFAIKIVKKRVVLEETGMEAIATIKSFEFYRIVNGKRDLRIKGWVTIQAGNLPVYDAPFNCNADGRLLHVLRTGTEIPAKINPRKPEEIRLFFESLYITNYMNI